MRGWWPVVRRTCLSRFLESWKEDVGRLNRKKVDRPYTYPGSLMTFMGYLHALLGVDFRGLQGFLRGLSKLVGFEVPDYAPRYAGE